MINNKTSLLVPSQLPEFVRDNPDYANFELFLTAYYEWMEQTGQVTDRSKNLLNYKDIDNTTSEFLSYFKNEFLPYFPKDVLIDEKQAIKIARELYLTKGTPASYKFLFRVLFNSDFDLFYTKDAVLKASDGIWYVAKSLKLASEDTNFLKIANYRLFGETTKSIATVETTVIAGTKMEVFISNIERLFESGEFVRVVDSHNQDVLFDGQPLRAKIVGQVSQLKIDPKNRGLLYAPGDPVVVYGGLSSNTGIGATAEVGETTAGSIQSIRVSNGGFGYRNHPNTLLSITNAPGANAIVASVNPDPMLTANLAYIPTDSIALKRYVTIGNSNYFFSNTATSNANTTLAKAFTFESFSTYPISSVLVINGGGGITKIPEVTAQSYIVQDDENLADIKTLGILAPIQIVAPGQGYVANDKIVFSGGSGLGAYANVTSVSANGMILNVEYVTQPGETVAHYPLGGMGYKSSALPQVSVLSANTQAANAVLTVPGIVGEGATFSVVVDRAGSVTTINLLDAGEDYITTPQVSLRVMDIIVRGVSVESFPKRGDIVYQGANAETGSFIAYVEDIILLLPDNDPLLSQYALRVYNYNSPPVPTLPLKIDPNISMTMANYAYDSSYNSNGIRKYGDGSAKANASFLNGLVVSQGQYLNTQGQPSSFSVLQDETYNNYTYEITVEKEISKYREVLLNLLHPTGMKVLGRYAIKTDTAYNYHALEAINQGHPLDHYTGYVGSSVTMVADFTNKSNNILQFNNLAGANIADFIFANSTIEVISSVGPSVRSTIQSINPVSNTVTLTDSTWLTFPNVATVTANAGSNVINITSLTGAFDIINNGRYANTDYPLKEIVVAGDKVLVANNTSRTVDRVDYVTNEIYLTTNLTSAANSLLSVNRTLTASGGSIVIYGPVGLQYIPELTTEDGRTIITEDGRIILLG